MKAKYFLLTLNLLFGLVAFAQFAPVGSKWYYGYGVGNGQPGIEGVYTYTCEADTIINSETYSKVIYQSRYDSSSGTFFITKDTANVYYWKNDAKKRLFKTNCNVGDTILIDLYFYRKIENPTPVNIDTAVSSEVVIKEMSYIKTNSLADDSLKHFGFAILNSSEKPFPAFYGYYTEKIINIGGDHNWNLLSMIDITGIPEGTDYLRCYTSPTYNYRNKYIPTDWACDFYNVGINDIDKKHNVVIYPNPNKGIFTLSFNSTEQKTIQVFDVLGNLVYTVKTAESKLNIELPNASKGLYFVHVQSANG